MQRKLFNLMGWLDAQLFRRVASMHYGGRGGGPSIAEPYVDPGKEHWRKVVVSGPRCSAHSCLRRMRACSGRCPGPEVSRLRCIWSAR